MNNLIARIPFTRTSRDRSTRREFRRGDTIDLKLDARQRADLIAGGYVLEVQDEQEKEALQTQLGNLTYPGDDCPEMDLVLVRPPVAPVTPRDPGHIPLPPPVPIRGKLTPLGQALLGSQFRKRIK